MTFEELQALRRYYSGMGAEMKGHQSPKLKRHLYICPLDQMVERGRLINDDASVYDRAIVLYSSHIMDGRFIF